MKAIQGGKGRKGQKSNKSNKQMLKKNHSYSPQRRGQMEYFTAINLSV